MECGGGLRDAGSGNEMDELITSFGAGWRGRIVAGKAPRFEKLKPVQDFVKSSEAKPNMFVGPLNPDADHW